MSSQRTALIAQYQAGFDEVAKSLEGFPSAAMREHPIPGKWSACEIVHHLADSETQSGIRLRRLLAEDRPVITPYDQEAWAAKLRYQSRDIAPSLEAFRSARSSTAQLLLAMREEDWTRQGWHPEHGLYTPEHWLKIYSVHAHNHAGQIRRLRDALKV
jgi:hypothetical protein